MNKTQEKILDVYREFVRVCEKHKLNFFAIGGTCLGAVRHGGFIPWDDDMDIAMPLEDYDKFRRIAPKELREPYELFDYKNHRHFVYKFLKLHNTTTTFIEDNIVKFEDRYTGVFIDIMPVAGWTDNRITSYLLQKYLNMIQKLDVSLRFRMREKPTIKSRIFSVLSKPFCIGKPLDFYSTKYEKLIHCFEFGKTYHVFFSWRIPLLAPYKNVFPLELFSKYINVPFEDTTIRIPQEYKEYLTMEFGNYMQLPPENQRTPLHPAIIDLEHSYKDYGRVNK